MIFISTSFRLYSFSNKLFLAPQHYYIIKRYHDSFGKIILNCRVRHQKPSETFLECTEMIEKTIGVNSLLEAFNPFYSKKIKKDVLESQLIVLRFGSVLALRAGKIAQRNGKKVLAELMSDVWDANWNHGVLGKIIAPFLFLATKHEIRKADYAIYVTQNFLQKRYPCKNQSIGVSDVVLKDYEEIVLKNRIDKIEQMDNTHITLMTTAAVNVKYKGQQYVIKAIPILNKMDIRVNYILVGGGDSSYLKRIAKKEGVEDQVSFAGLQTMDGVISYLDKADIYIQPSLQEGLPRSVVEAMSRGCPCIGARTAGIPELIEDKFIFKRKSVADIVAKILLIISKENMKKAASYNFKKCKEFTESDLNSKRNDFYNTIKENCHINL